MHSDTKSIKDRRPNGRAALYIDYENLYNLLDERLDKGYPDETISEMIDELRRHLADDKGTETAFAIAYADFGNVSDQVSYIQRALYLQGAEARFVSSALQANAVEIQICVDAMEVLHQRPDVDTLVILSGDRIFLPLIQQFRRAGRNVLVAGLQNPPEALRVVDADFFVDALDLLHETTRRELVGRNGKETATDGASGPAEPVPVVVRRIENAVTLEALTIVEEHFGQYEEVYLTPLLRKFSELMDEKEQDPKVLVSDLEACGAVRLEKRKGFPHDYTVLIVDQDHPDVRRVQEELEVRIPGVAGNRALYEHVPRAVNGANPGSTSAFSDYADSAWDDD